MTAEQLYVCVAFACIVYGIGFWRGTQEGTERARKPPR